MRILVVDDEVPICELLDEFLSQEGHQVMTAHSGEGAICKFEETLPHMVLLDIKMGGISGIEVLRRIKEIDPNAGVIMLSAFGDSQTIQNAIQGGADYYMEKPIELRRLRELLAKWDVFREKRGCDDFS